MPAKKAPKNNRLEEALAALIQTQATFVQNQAAFLSRVSEMDQRLIRMEGNLETILRVLSQHAEILEGLPESIRQKIGFKPQE